jgi:hypothetical protein
LSESDNYPQRQNNIEDDYIDGNVQIVLRKVIERLIAGEGFASLHLSSPFHADYQFHEKELVVLRILNWPTITQDSHHS